MKFRSLIQKLWVVTLAVGACAWGLSLDHGLEDAPRGIASAAGSPAAGASSAGVLHWDPGVENHLKKLLSEVRLRTPLAPGESELALVQQENRRILMIQDGLKTYYSLLMPDSERRDLERFWRSYYLREQMALVDGKAKAEPITAAQARSMGHRAMHSYLKQLLEVYTQSLSSVSKSSGKKMTRVQWKAIFESYEKAFKGADIRGVDKSGRQAPYRISSLEKRISRKVFREAFPEPRDLQSHLKSKLGFSVDLSD
jgi:hypothetical protein